MAITLVGGEVAGHPLAGVTASIGALSGGFASLQGTYRSRAGWVMVATAALALSAFVGGTVGHLEGLDIAVIAVWGLAAGMLAAFGPGQLAVGLQAVVGLVVFSQFTFSPALAAQEAALVLAGGGVQALMVAALWPLRRFPAERRALGAAYEQLAAYATSLRGAPGALGDPSYLEAAGSVLRDPQPFAPKAPMLAYQALGDQAERLRLELARLSEDRRRLGALEEPARVADVDTTTALAAEVLAEVAAALRSGSEPSALEGFGATMRSAIERLRADPGRGDARGGDRRRREVGLDAASSVEALAGQLRAAFRLAAIPARGTASVWPDELPSLERDPAPRRRRRALAALHDAREQLAANLDLSSQAARHAVRLAGALVAAVAISHAFAVGHGYWLPLTVVVVLRADFITTFSRGLARSIGTVAGAGLVTLLLAETRPPHSGLVVLTLAFYFAAITILFANYAAYSVFVAALVVTLLAFAGAPAPALAGERSLFTLLGAGLALLAYGLWPTRERGVVAERLAALIEADASYGRFVLGQLAGEKTTGRGELRRRRVAARLARSNAEASVDRWLTEPFHHGSLTPELVSGVLAALRRYVRAMLALHATLPAREEEPTVPELTPLADQVELALSAAAKALRDGPVGRPRPGVPSLRATQLALAAALENARGAHPGGEESSGSPGHLLVLADETDVAVDAVDSLLHLVGLG